MFSLDYNLHIFLKFLGQLCRSKNVFLHTDAAQAVGKIPINVSDWKVDLMSISGHKIYGPKGAPCKLIHGPVTVNSWISVAQYLIVALSHIKIMVNLRMGVLAF